MAGGKERRLGWAAEAALNGAQRCLSRASHPFPGTPWGGLGTEHLGGCPLPSEQGMFHRDLLLNISAPEASLFIFLGVLDIYVKHVSQLTFYKGEYKKQKSNDLFHCSYFKT